MSSTRTAAPSDAKELRRHVRLVLAHAGLDAEPGASQPHAAPDALGTAAVLGLGGAPRPLLLAPVLPEAGLMLVHGPRGVGRSHVLVGCAAALAAGDRFLGWRARRAVDVLYISGAASAAMLGGRLGAAMRAMQGRDGLGERLRLMAPEGQEAAMPALDSAQGQARLVPLIASCDVVVIDDASPLMPGMSGNAPRSEWRFGEFLRRLRRAGRTVIVGQASGPQMRGRADRGALAGLEAQADIVIGLRRPAGYTTSDGARFELHIERAAHMPGGARLAREVRLEAGGDGQPLWSAARTDELANDRFHALIAEGMSAPEAARELGLPRTTAWRWARQRADAADSAAQAGAAGAIGARPACRRASA